jgi:trehalose 6-phosphate phosphatase
LEHLLASWPKIADQVQNARQILFLCDYDGTLTPIQEKPELAVLSEPARVLLETLSKERRFIVGVISGRALSDLKEKVGLPKIIYAGNHGFEIEGPGISFVNPIADEIKPFLRIVRQALNLTIGTIKGVFVEDKGITLSVHYRLVDKENTNHVKLMIDKAVQGPVAMGMINVTKGKKVYEVRPAVNWDKGKAVRYLMKRYGKGGRYSGLLPIYLGDDLTDEDAFRTIEKYGKGISVLIGEEPRDSQAKYFLRSTEEVQMFIGKLLECSKRGLLCEKLSTI